MASKHAVTWFTPNFMMLVSEVREPVDLVIGHQQTRWTNFREFVTHSQQRYMKAYAIARESLCAQANRRKDIYDRTVVKQKFHIGQ